MEPARFYERPRVVVPGHNGMDGPELLASSPRLYLTLLRDEAWRRRDSVAMNGEDSIAEGGHADLMIKRHPDWEGREWIRPGDPAAWLPEHYGADRHALGGALEAADHARAGGDGRAGRGCQGSNTTVTLPNSSATLR